MLHAFVELMLEISNKYLVAKKGGNAWGGKIKFLLCGNGG